MKGWIKLHRKLKTWEWYHKSEMVHLFIHFLLSANHDDGTWQGIEIKRGQFITGLNALNYETSISVQTIRTCINRLKSTNEITIESTNKNSIVTICNYDDYNDLIVETNKQINRQTNKQLTFNQQTTNNKQEERELKKENKEEVFNFKKSLLKLGIECKIVDDWIKVRKNKKATNSETAFNSIKNELEKSSISANDNIKIAVEKSWSGFKVEWIKNLSNAENIKNNDAGDYEYSFKGKRRIS